MENTQQGTGLRNEIIKMFKETQLGREGMIPTKAMKPDALMELKALEAEGVVVKLPPSELDRYCPGPRYGLKGESYPMSVGQIQIYRNSPSIGKMLFTQA